jgi:hypothetical protein
MAMADNETTKAPEDEALENLGTAISTCAERAHRVAGEGNAVAAGQYATAAELLARAYQQLASSRPKTRSWRPL